MTKNAAKILLESLQKVRQRSSWRYLFGSVLTHAIRTNEPFNPIFLGKKKYCITFVLIMGIFGNSNT